jgi:phasin family protein
LLHCNIKQEHEMADQNGANDTGADKAETAVATPAAAKPEVKAEAAPARRAVRTKTAAKPTARRAKATRVKAAKPRKTKTAKTAANIRTLSVRAGTIRSKGAEIMNKQTRKGAEATQIAADQFKSVFGDVNDRAKVAAERSAKIVEEFADLTRGNVEAMVASSKVAAKAVESLSQDAAEYSRKSFEEASSALKTFAEAKSATDFFRLQSDFARTAFDNAIAESARISETVLKIAGDVAQPITNRYTVAAERVKTLAA